MGTYKNQTLELVKRFNGGCFQGTAEADFQKKQSGGALFYNPFIPSNRLVKMRFNLINRAITYENVPQDSNNFTDVQRRDIDALVNFLLPFIVHPVKKQIVGPDIIKELEVLGAGTFGITIAYKDLLIKILKLDNSRLKSVIDELNISGILFNDANGQKYTDVPASINPIYGFLTSNSLVWNQITNKPNLDGEYDKMRLFTNLEIFDLNQLKLAVKGLNSEVNYLMQGHIAALFLKKADLSLTSFIEGFKELPVKDKISILLKFYKDMFAALDYIHMKRGYIHNDIKPDNIVIDTPSNFQLIDFGLLNKIVKIDENQPRHGGTPIYWSNTVYGTVTNIFYDWHCVLLSALQMIEFDITGSLYGSNPLIFDDQIQKGFTDALKLYFRNLLTNQTVTKDIKNSLKKLINIMGLNYRMYKYTVGMPPQDLVSPNIPLIMGRFKNAIDAQDS